MSVIEQLQARLEQRDSRLEQRNARQSSSESDISGTELSAPLSAAAVGAMLLRGRRTIMIAGAVSLIAAAIFAFLLPLNYTATASFIPPGSGTESSAAALMGQLASFGGAGGFLESKSKGDLYVGMLKSSAISRQIVERYGLMKVYGVKKESQAEKRLASKSFFATGVKDPIVSIEVTDHSPERARDLAQGYLDALQSTTSGLSLTESSQRRLFFEQRLASEKDSLADAEVAQKQVEEKTGLVAPAGQTASNIQALAQIQAQITTQQAQLASLLHDETEQNPDVLRVRSEIGSLQARAQQMETGAVSGFGKLSTAQVPGLELEYIRKARDVKYHESLFDIISKQYEAARLDEAKDAPLQVLDKPTVPDMKSGPSRSIIMFVGLVAGLLGSAAWVLLRGATS